MSLLRNRDAAFFISLAIAALLLIAGPVAALNLNTLGGTDIATVTTVPAVSEAINETIPTTEAPARVTQGVQVSVVVEQPAAAVGATDVEIGTACVIEADGTSVGC